MAIEAGTPDRRMVRCHPMEKPCQAPLGPVAQDLPGTLKWPWEPTLR